MIEALIEPVIGLFVAFVQLVAIIVGAIFELLFNLILSISFSRSKPASNDVAIEKDSPDVDFPRGPSFPPPSEDELGA